MELFIVMDTARGGHLVGAFRDRDTAESVAETNPRSYELQPFILGEEDVSVW